MIKVLRDTDGLYKISVHSITRKFVNPEPKNALFQTSSFVSEADVKKFLNTEDYEIENKFFERNTKILPQISDEELKKRLPPSVAAMLEPKKSDTALNIDIDATKNICEDLLYLKGMGRLLKCLKKSKNDDHDFVCGFADALMFLFPKHLTDIQEMVEGL